MITNINSNLSSFTSANGRAILINHDEKENTLEYLTDVNGNYIIFAKLDLSTCEFTKYLVAEEISFY